MEAETFLEGLKRKAFFQKQIAHVEVLPERPAQFAEVAEGLKPQVRGALADQGIERL